MLALGENLSSYAVAIHPFPLNQCLQVKAEFAFSGMKMIYVCISLAQKSSFGNNTSHMLIQPSAGMLEEAHHKFAIENSKKQPLFLCITQSLGFKVVFITKAFCGKLCWNAMAVYHFRGKFFIALHFHLDPARSHLLTPNPSQGRGRRPSPG